MSDHQPPVRPGLTKRLYTRASGRQRILSPRYRLESLTGTMVANTEGDWVEFTKLREANNRITKLADKNASLEQENAYLRQLLETRGWIEREIISKGVVIALPENNCVYLLPHGDRRERTDHPQQDAA